MVVKKIGGWQQLNVEEIYENPWIKITHEDVLTPAGTPGIYGVVHFKNRAVGVIPIDEDGNTWLVRQSRYTLDCYTWEIPEGGAPYGEDMLEAAKRELEEETGLKARDWSELMTIHQSNSVSDEVAKLYVAKGLYEGRQQLEATEDITVEKMPLTKAIDMVKNGEITDALSVAALLRLALDGVS
ncbi:NUDIX domain-containing protein [Teredinibacter haidensis]|uniref:NUDIX domain-containing protein n=1 Tax=Teredinibacter haidensis TaxID=2731755 RepID=UPI000948F3BA|nr:NUDIX hydrolase [Teredinibacter haidensis]